MSDAKYKKTIVESRRKAIERITEKKRSNQSKQNRSSVEKQLEDNRFRLKWKTDMKGKRRDQLHSQVDEEILKKTIKKDPNFLDFSKLDILNPLSGLNLELEDEPNFDIEPNPIDLMILRSKHDSTCLGVRSNSVDGLSASNHFDRSTSSSVLDNGSGNGHDVSTNISTGSALLNKFSRKIVKKTPNSGDYHGQVTSPTEAASPNGSQVQAKDNSTSDPMHGTHGGVSSRLNLPDQSDRLVDNVFVVGPDKADVEASINSYISSVGSNLSNDTPPIPMSMSRSSNSNSSVMSPTEKMKRTQSGKKLIEARSEKLAPRLLYSFCVMDSEIEELCFPRFVITFNIFIISLHSIKLIFNSCIEFL